ncbi:MAG: polysaccharide biosynthesis protein [Polyangiaceae bacterium]|nr:polysaccharide biosynthesis protein [Polyangiaceae bacterium]
MRRTVVRSLQIAADLVVLSAAFWAAFGLRFEGDLPYAMVKRAAFAWPYVVALQYAVLATLGVPRIAWRFVGMRDAIRIGQALGVAAVLLVVARQVAAALRPQWWAFEYAWIPLGVTAIDLAFAFLGLVGLRAVRRLMAEGRPDVSVPRRELAPTLLVGAGKGGLLVARELEARPDLGLRAIGFVDDDPMKVGSSVHGLRVLGSTSELPAILEHHQATTALITMSSAPGDAIRRISDRCRAAGLATKIVPGLHEIVGGSAGLSRIRDVAIEDLLRREAVALDQDGLSAFVSGRSVLVTGAGGSIGSELCRQLLRFGPRKLVLAERFENALFEIHRELASAGTDVDLVPVVADVTDELRLRTLFERHRPEVVFHAAAHKHVPMMERDPGEAVKNNVFGTKTVADLSARYAAGVFVLISTDKAVNPTSVMGATKRVAECYVQTLASSGATRFVTVRFGNVLGSNGSVIPIFKRQIEAGGPITVTHPEMRRYFMTIPEASQLVLQAASMGRGGEIFVLDMGEPVKIVDLARDLIRLSGFAESEIAIEFTGVRPGEKLFEELSFDEEAADKTRHPKIYVGRRRGPASGLEAALAALRHVCDGAAPEDVRQTLMRALPEYRPPSPPEPQGGVAQGPVVESTAGMA